MLCNQYSYSLAIYTMFIFTGSIVVEKQLGSWANDGVCEGNGADISCGPGNQKQTRTCIDGTTDKCTSADIERTIWCRLPACSGKELLVV